MGITLITQRDYERGKVIVSPMTTRVSLLMGRRVVYILFNGIGIHVTFIMSFSISFIYKINTPPVVHMHCLPYMFTVSKQVWPKPVTIVKTFLPKNSTLPFVLFLSTLFRGNNSMQFLILQWRQVCRYHPSLGQRQLLIHQRRVIIQAPQKQNFRI